ncbi:FKBP-type peptidyl-prolyl cis-trans isomerase [Bacteroides nordii]|uniref:FKBP-type peptidyl-prolyl cis-trans isomerase n=1 Tax=Bacteroides nordii TaxID=291645 RepID=UPI00399B2528
MNKKIYLLPILLLALVFTSCEETKEVSRYDNWQARNEAFIDSLYNVYTTEADHGGLDSIHLMSDPEGYIFYKELTPITDEVIEGYVSQDMQPFYTDSVYMYYKGTLIIGDRFVGNFQGENPTAFDSPTKFYVSNAGTTGLSEILQRMNVGARWRVYIPWKYGYNSSGYGSILGYTTLIYDMQLYSIENRSSNSLSTLAVEE